MPVCRLGSCCKACHSHHRNLDFLCSCQTGPWQVLGSRHGSGPFCQKLACTSRQYAATVVPFQHLASRKHLCACGPAHSGNPSPLRCSASQLGPATKPPSSQGAKCLKSWRALVRTRLALRCRDSSRILASYEEGPEKEAQANHTRWRGGQPHSTHHNQGEPDQLGEVVEEMAQTKKSVKKGLAAVIPGRNQFRYPADRRQVTAHQAPRNGSSVGYSSLSGLG